MEKLTPRQKDTLLYIQQYIKDMQMPPTRNEIAIGLGITDNAAQDHVKRLVAKEYIEVLQGISRGIRVLRRVIG